MMGIGSLLGGARLQVSTNVIAALSHQASRWALFPSDPHAFAIAAEIASALAERGYQTTRPRRGKPDDVRFRCVKGDCQVDLFVICNGQVGDLISFWLDAWGYANRRDGDAHYRLEGVWTEMQAIMNDALTTRLGAVSLSWESGSEVDARYIAKQP